MDASPPLEGGIAGANRGSRGRSPTGTGPTADGTDDLRRRRRHAWALLAALGLFRLWFCTSFELTGDEAHYWLWSRRLDIGYYSKGPLVAWTIRAGTAVFGDTVLGVRAFAPILSVLGGALLFELARKLFDARTAWTATVIAATALIFQLGGLLMTTDPLSVFFWIAAALALLRAAEGRAAGPWLAAGALVALGVLAKFTNLAQLACFAAFLLWDRDARRRWREPGVWIMAVVALLGLLPPLIWNAGNDWITWRHLEHRGALDAAFRLHPGELLAFAASQAGALSVVYFAGLLVAAARGAHRRTGRPRAVRFLASLVLPLPLFYGLLSLNGEWEANWTAPALALCPALLAGLWRPLAAEDPRWRRAGLAAVVSAAALAAVFHAAILSPWIYGNDRFRRWGGFEDLGRRVAAMQADHGASFLVASGRGDASLLAFYTPGRPPVYAPPSENVENQFSLWPGYRERPAGESALLIGKASAALARARERVGGDFEEIVPLGRVTPDYRGRPMRTYEIFLCRGLKNPRDGT
jgi:hypothetical protein